MIIKGLSGGIKICGCDSNRSLNRVVPDRGLPMMKKKGGFCINDLNSVVRAVKLRNNQSANELID